MDDIIYHQQKK